MIVDDSPTFRLLVKTILADEPGIQVVGEAINGKEALLKCERVKPDIITMDIHMPSMNGYEAIESIMAEMPCPIIVLTGTESSWNEKTREKAIKSGALAALPKPKDIQGIDIAADNLINKIKSMSEIKVVRRRNFASPAKPIKRDNFNTLKKKTIKVIGIGASTGGPPAINTILSGLSSKITIPILIVQHISQGFVANLAKWLSSNTFFNVKIAEHGQRLEPGGVYIGRDNYQLTITRDGRIYLKQIGLVDGHEPSATVLFSSIAQEYGDEGMGILLTGMGSDGASGLKKLADTGALTIAQDEETSVVFGMPKEAIALGAARKILPLGGIAPFLNQRLI